jgi:hypothetical protein
MPWYGSYFCQVVFKVVSLILDKEMAKKTGYASEARITCFFQSFPPSPKGKGVRGMGHKAFSVASLLKSGHCTNHRFLPQQSDDHNSPEETRVVQAILSSLCYFSLFLFPLGKRTLGVCVVTLETSKI